MINLDQQSGVSPSADQVFMESVVEERPEILTGPAIQYPDLLRQAGVSGRVIVQAIIDKTGRAEPASVKVMQSPTRGSTSRQRTTFWAPCFDLPGFTVAPSECWSTCRSISTSKRIRSVR